MGKYISESKTKHGTVKRKVWKDDFGLFAGVILRLQAVHFLLGGSRVRLGAKHTQTVRKRHGTS